MQDLYNFFLDSLAAVEEAGGNEEVTKDCKFVLTALLCLALNLDYTDEIE
jgi:hypothetical protein